MVRPKRHVTAARANGSKAAKKQSHKRVPVMAMSYDSDYKKNGKRHLRIEYLPKPPKGYVYAMELSATTYCLKNQRRRSILQRRAARSETEVGGG